MIFILLVLWKLLSGKLLQWMLQKVTTSRKATNIFIYYRGIGSFCKTIYRTIASTIKACYCIMISIAILLLHLAFCLFSLEAWKVFLFQTNSCKTIIAMAFNFLLHRTLRHFLTWTFFSRLSLMAKKGIWDCSTVERPLNSSGFLMALELQNTTAKIFKHILASSMQDQKFKVTDPSDLIESTLIKQYISCLLSKKLYL